MRRGHLAPSSTSELVARARSEREARAAVGARLAAAAIIRSYCLGLISRRRVCALLRADVSVKLQQIAAISAVVAARGLPRFVPPAAALESLGSRAALMFSHASHVPSSDAALFAAVCALIVRSINETSAQASAVLHAPTACTLFPRLARCCVRVIMEPAHAPNVRCAALDLLTAATGCGSLHAQRSDARALPTILRVRHVLAELRFGSRVASSVCIHIPLDDALASVAAPAEDRILAGRTVTLVSALAATDTTASRAQTAIDVVEALLPLPMLFQRIETDDKVMQVMMASPRPVQRHPLCDVGVLRTIAQAVTHVALNRSIASWLTSLVTPDDDGKRSRNFTNGSRSTALHLTAATVGPRAIRSLPDMRIAAWPAAAFVLGNVVLVLSDSLESAAVAKVPATDVIPLIQLLAAAVSLLPDAVWSSTTPVLWVKAASPSNAAASTITQQRAETPIPAPPLLVSAMRRLSSDHFVLALASVCLGAGGPPEPSMFTHSRLRLPTSEDPEAATYDPHTSADISLPAAWAGAAHASSARRLAAPPPLALSLLRGAWRGITSATSFFKWAARRSTHSNAENVAEKPASVLPCATSVVAGAISATVAGPTEARPLAIVSANTAAQISRTPVTLWLSAQAAASFCQAYALLSAPREVHGIRGSDVDGAVFPRVHVLNALAFTPSLALLSRLWAFLNEPSGAVALLPRQRGDMAGGALDSSAFFPSADAWPSRADASHPVWAALTLFATVLGHAALILDDNELYGDDGACVVGGLPLRELRHAVRVLRDMVVRAEGVGVDAGSLDAAASAAYAAAATPLWKRFVKAASGTLRLLYDRHCVRPLGPQHMWSVDLAHVALSPPAGSGAVSAPQATTTLAAEAQRRLVATGLPFTIPFIARAQAYNNMRAALCAQAHEGPPFRIRVARGPRLFETAYAALSALRGPALRQRISVVFTNAAGTEESGIDAGGLFKDLWITLAETAFDPAYGLFAVTSPASGGELYPNPASTLCSGIPDELAFEFVGRLIGKALFEGITLGPRFAPFFLARFAGRPVALYHLPSLDHDLARSLRFVAHCDDDDVLRSLCLTFMLPADSASVGGSDIELIPGGADVPVTAANRHAFVARAVDYLLSRRTARQTEALLRGVHEVIPPAWLAPFSAPELQVLISGSGCALDVSSWRGATVYANGYTSASKAVADFWAIVGDMNARERSLLLRFATACPRAPPLGFAQLEPRFTLQRVELTRGGDGQLPSAATCFHTLRLPPYPSRATMKSKLLMAIQAGAGFELT